MRLALLLLALQAGSGARAAPAGGDTTVFRPDSAAMATAYADAAARDLVRRARAQRGAIDSTVHRYRATSRQRVSVMVRAFRRDRLVYRREVAGRVDWRRDGPRRVEILGARETVPVVMRGVRVPDDLDDWARSFVPDPGGDRLFVAPREDGFAWHPLIEGGEAVYRYAAGDTTVIRLPDGRSVRLAELRVTPRTRDFRLVTGSLWIELDGHAIVRAAFRPAREFDLERDLAAIDPDEADDVDEVPGFLKPIQFDARYLAVEYGLWEMRWWMPRVIAFDGWLRVGPARFPITFEVAYSDYEVEAHPAGLPPLPVPVFRLAGDPYARARPAEWRTRVVLADTAELLDSPLLPASLYSEDASLLTEQELRDLADQVRDLPGRPWEAGRPRVALPWQLGSGLLRFNRVEGLSAGIGVDWDLTRARVDLTARLGTADLEPRAELGLELPGTARTWRAAAYHRLDAADPSVRPFGLGASLVSFLFGADDGQYFEATGAELLVEPAEAARHFGVRLYAERQAPVAVETDFSVRRALGGGAAARPNIDAARADQVGLALEAGFDRGLDPTGFRWGARARVAGEAGTHVFVRPGLSLHAAAPLPGRLVGAVEVAGGTTLVREGRDPPVQAHWFLGGPGTLRGFPGGALHGPDHVRARAEIGSEHPAARLVLFSDAGWAGPAFRDYHADRVHVAVGAGASFLDGLVRADLARAVHPVTRWRVDVYVDALF